MPFECDELRMIGLAEMLRNGNKDIAGVYVLINHM